MELRIETKPRRGWAIPAAAIIALLLFGQSLAKFWIDYQWWTEMGQLATWTTALKFEYGTNLAEWLSFFAVKSNKCFQH